MLPKWTPAWMTQWQKDGCLSHFHGVLIYIFHILLSTVPYVFGLNTSGQIQDFYTFRTQDSFPAALRDLSQMPFSTSFLFSGSVGSKRPPQRRKDNTERPKCCSDSTCPFLVTTARQSLPIPLFNIGLRAEVQNHVAIYVQYNYTLSTTSKTLREIYIFWKKLQWFICAGTSSPYIFMGSVYSSKAMCEIQQTQNLTEKSSVCFN